MKEDYLKFMGVRGSYPVSGPDVTDIGGHTASIALSVSHSLCFLDAGTGLIKGKSLLSAHPEKTPVIRIFLTHLHLDHIQGLPFFDPLFKKDRKVEIYCPDYPGVPAEEFLLSFFNHPVSPIGNSGIKADLKIYPLALEQSHSLSFDNGLRIETFWERSHPTAGVFIYRVHVNGCTIVYATDVEAAKGFDAATIDFIRGCDILIHDSQYFEEDYLDAETSKIGYGHSTCMMAADTAGRAEAGSLYLFHYDPEYDDRVFLLMRDHAGKRFG